MPFLTSAQGRCPIPAGHSWPGPFGRGGSVGLRCGKRWNGRSRNPGFLPCGASYSYFPLIQLWEDLDFIKLYEWSTDELLDSTTNREDFKCSVSLYLFLFILQILAEFYLEEGTRVWSLVHNPACIFQSLWPSFFLSGKALLTLRAGLRLGRPSAEDIPPQYCLLPGLLGALRMWVLGI